MRDDQIDTTEFKKKMVILTLLPLRLQARMIANGSHDDKDDPPRVPMIIHAPIPKKQNRSL